MKRTAEGLRALLCAAVLAASTALPAVADEQVAAAFERMLDSNEQILDVLEAIDGPESFEAQRGALIAVLEEAEADAGEVTEYMADEDGNAAVIADYAPRVEAHYARRAEVQEAMVERLDPETLDQVEAILMGAR